jgi:hypothetical protein
MKEFNTSLVREKIIFIDDSETDKSVEDAQPTVIRSNRIFLNLKGKGTSEKVVVRAQNMHTTLRLAGRIMASYFRSGLILPRATPFDWEKQWDSLLPIYEKEFNPKIWAAVYINGQPVFKTTTSPFVDVIEKCALLTIDNYDATMNVTESALKQVGRAMRINHSSNVAAVFTDNDDMMRCGIIHRTEGKDTTFSFTAAGGESENRIVQSMGIAGAFLEALNLRFFTKILQDKARRGEIPKVSPEANQLRGATARLVAINKGISDFETTYEVKYRPEKPDFFG